MKNNFSLKFKIFDIFVLSFAIISIVASIITTNVAFSKSINNESVVQIYYQNELLKNNQIKLKNVENEIEIVLKKEDYDKLHGDMTIIINKEKGICIKEAICPNKTCINQGFVKSVGYPLVCVPNGVYVIITSPSPDQDIVLG